MIEFGKYTNVRKGLPGKILTVLLGILRFNQFSIDQHREWRVG